MKHVLKVVGFPDLHPGKGYPIGSVTLTEKAIYPNLIGDDIGCGMSLIRTGLKEKRVNPEKLYKSIQSIDN